MSLISITFLAFMTAAFVGYFILPLKLRPYFLLLASLYFYACFGLEAFFYLGTTALSTFAFALLMPKAKKLFLTLSVVLNFGLLVVVKYLNFSLELTFGLFDAQAPVVSLIVPLGIAFYTMQAVSYSVDVCRGKYPAERNFFKFLLYMTYFPIIMQGPISRYDQLGAQVFTPHRFSFERMKAGLSLALYGFFKKMVIADRAAILVDQVFGNYLSHSGMELLIAAVFYTVQIYADFSGCVDICRGVSQVVGIELTENFKHPYFSTSIKDFWRRWHCSLSSWFRDYIYIPLGGSRKGKVRKHLNLTLVFVASGLWHGVGLQFIAWGLLHAFYQVFGELTAPLRGRFYDRCKIKGKIFRFGQQIFTFGLLVISWIFFRATSLSSALHILKTIVLQFDPISLLREPFPYLGLDSKDLLVFAVAVCVLWVVSLLQRKGSVRERLEKKSFLIRYPVYLIAIFTILIFGIYGPGYDAAQFIYMQF